MVAVLLGLAAPWTAAFLLVRRAWPLPRSPWRTLLRVSLATGLAIGLSSLAYFLWAVIAGPQRPGLLAAELILFGVLALCFGRAQAANPRMNEARGFTSPAHPLLLFAFGFVLLGALAVAGWYLWHSPHGDWDAWAIWNLRGRFLYRGGDHWTAAFSPRLPWTHPDYPLLVPAAVARGWSMAGQESTLVPRLIAGLFGAATVGLLMAVLALLRSPSQGYLGGMVLLATPYFVELTTAQYADVPLGFFFLASAALFEVHDRAGSEEARLPWLAGLLTALAAWTKNEGSLFLAVTVLVRSLAAVRPLQHGDWRPFAAFLFGLLPVALVLVYFKLRLAPVNDLVAGQGQQATIERLLDPKRYAVIAGYFLQALLAIGPGAVLLLAGYRVLLGRPPRRTAGTHSSAVLALMLAGYAGVYLTTPNDLAWHLHDSIHRLFMQLWPTVLLAFFLDTATPEEARTPGDFVASQAAPRV